ncbi:MULTISPECIES: aminomethyl-transferring glycine dehydrogenase [Delftia]|uniref:Glycine dehydrogenase (decarboxylating) n=1 Tax=Delftia tsuruhatensis TaxID=180282 RepID=A0AAX3SUF4_9BURK|nr:MULTISPECIES: aminomethyl-transferring glycine dehydrogenase [Delftia]MDH0773100.1 aminomethyl-transferring glycine dehydrogenase [Delftia tsuruhatensis]MDH1457674.1 aminomethyl-transferring glycine dehydrogenase [Delftia tsuruhatensis]MDH1823999.1 aminomethyl-transferring glycine dehydrogenase [Delftia tsuruhatensis]MPT03867.1 glycine dehydrogenase (aminomethyl-transferring) [Delftia sp.]OJX26187.1 MAG: glycine dehydrogenase (aminomethyl-transferring) [Delftia sp. 67-8]
MLMSSTQPLAALENATEFVARHIGIAPEDEAHMLSAIGAASRDALIDAIVPPSIRRHQPMALPPAATEAQALAELKALAGRNQLLKSFIGQGYYGTHTPGVILRNILENPAWYTAYTPYQAEISQGRMEALVNFQTMVCDLTAMPIANASMLDEATAAAEAMTLAKRSVKSKSNRFVVAGDAHPQTIEVIQTRAAPLGIEVLLANSLEEWNQLMEGDYFAVLAQYPATSGRIDDLRADVDKAHGKQAAFIVATDLLALTLITPPGEWGADIVVGTTQRFGMPMGAGGPHAAFMACRDEFKRSLPGRLVGVSVDVHGKPAYRLALQTREQHIRREKATSNICTAQVLPAVVASMYAVYHGPEGLERIARRVASYTAILARGLAELGAPLREAPSFDTLSLHTGAATQAIVERAVSLGANLRVYFKEYLCISLDETTTRADVELLWKIFARDGQALPSFTAFEKGVEPLIPDGLRRSSAFLTHPVFNTHRSETAMLRYIRQLSDKDLALDRSMIPLGSCTMKLNATSEMIPITWPEFAQVHPFAPADQQQGYAELDKQLRDWLCQATGYAGISLQPNAGSQGEYAGLLAIKGWHASRGQSHRNVCLIPSSAHGTNPASAQMVGMQVVVTACDANGNVDMADLAAKCEQHSANLACIMITYPSTHGVFETQVKELCKLVHDHGGRVYVDGANMNALVGLAAPGSFGGDVSHLNLHKTFCIPHGGGGPGVGPVCVVEDLVPFLPGHATTGLAGGTGAISAAPLGNAAVLPISWMYIRMMGAQGLTLATETAILSANYISARLRDHYPTLYAGEHGHVAHECILDLRQFKESTGVMAEDVAKRLIDYGFHAPTLSFPVPNTLMVEPTESESLYELDRFVDAMIAIREEIRAIEQGRLPQDDNPLKNAPHTAETLLASEWTHPYSREAAAYPVAALRQSKYWCPVGRVDNVYGDRNLYCSCIPVDAYLS